MIRCLRCNEPTPRLSLNQTHCPPCEREVARLIEADTRRRQPRFSVGKSLDRWSPA
jgi:hypothetical protein